MASVPPRALPRSVPAASTTPGDTPAGAQVRVQSGVVQLRDFGRAGLAWQETYPLVKARSATDMAWLARLKWFKARSLAFWLDHPLLPGSGIPPNGDAGSSSPVVDGAGQTGDTLDTRGWEAGRSNVMRAGDVFRLGTAGESDDLPPSSGDVVRAFQVLADVDADGSGLATVPIDPPIFSGLSIADGTNIQIVDVRLWATVVPSRTDLQRPSSMVDKFGGLRAAFVEVLNP